MKTDCLRFSSILSDSCALLFSTMRIQNPLLCFLLLFYFPNIKLCDLVSMTNPNVTQQASITEWGLEAGIQWEPEGQGYGVNVPSVLRWANSEKMCYHSIPRIQLNCCVVVSIEIMMFLLGSPRKWHRAVDATAIFALFPPPTTKQYHRSCH